MKALRIIFAFLAGIGLAVCVLCWPAWQRALLQLIVSGIEAIEWLIYG